MGDARAADATGAGEFRDVVGGGLAFHGGVGGEDQLAHLTGSEPRVEPVEFEFFRTDAVQRRQVPVQHVVQALKAARAVDGLHVGRALDHAQQAAVALRRAAQGAHVEFGQVAALLATADPLHGIQQHLPQAPAAVAVAHQQVKRHAPRRFRADARQALQGLRQRVDQALGHAGVRTAGSCPAA